MYGVYVTRRSTLPKEVKEGFKVFIKKQIYPVIYRGKVVYKIYIYLLEDFKGIKGKNVQKY